MNTTTLSLIVIFFATLMSVSFVPQYPQPAGALVVPGSIMACAFLLILSLEFIYKGVLGVIRTHNILLFGIIYWVLLDVIQGLYPVNLEKEIIESTFIAIGLFAGCIVLGNSLPITILPRSIYRLAFLDPKPKLLMRLIIICFLLGIFYFAYKSGFSIAVMYDGLMQGRFGASWARGNIGGWDSFIEHLSYFSYLLPILTVWLAHLNRSWLRPGVLIAAGLTLIMLAFIAQGGSRSNVGAMVCSGMLFWIIINAHRITFIRIMLIATSVAVLLGSLNYILKVRNYGIGNAANIERNAEEISGIRVDDNFYRIVQTIKYFPEVKDHAGVQWIVYALVRPVPRVLWPGKPISSGVEISEIVVSYGASLSSSIIGEAYAAFGWLGIIGTGLFFGLLGRSFNQILTLPGEKSAAVIYALCAMALFLGLRSLIGLVLMSYPILAFWALATIYKRQLLKRNRLYLQERMTP